MDGLRMRTLQAKGYRIAAAKTGLLHTLYRPSGATNPLAAGNMVGTLPVAWKPSSPGDRFQGANLYGKPTWFGYFDFSLTKVGDYLVRQEDGGIWFLATQQHLLQPTGIECNHTLNVLRPFAASGVGVLPYGGDQTSQETPIMTGWPGSMLQGTKGERPEVALPGDVRSPWYVVLLPSVPGVDIETDDVLTDEDGNRYKVSSTERTDLGWRLSVALAET